MIYKELSLKNFSSYRSAKFNFQTDDKKNVVVIYGLNGHGKSTIINGLKLAIQGSDAGLLEDETYDQYLLEHFNQQALQDGERNASVS
ncbi:ATP-binding protein [Peribacillus frigoritolerans]|uniref:ATP-binding protein n=1 Tax=Peribacillus frigoritolerans TaxID=450367 RepID=UPI0025A2663C|nr:ATP-binding protein [Peribacillus frigoritolerans]MDM5309691.1 ATP-binding protein [Peribacillus frigoritolerans]